MDAVGVMAAYCNPMCVCSSLSTKALSYGTFYNLSAHPRVCVCVCVCVYSKVILLEARCGPEGG